MTDILAGSSVHIHFAKCQLQLQNASQHLKNAAPCKSTQSTSWLQGTSLSFNLL